MFIPKNYQWLHNVLLWCFIYKKIATKFWYGYCKYSYFILYNFCIVSYSINAHRAIYLLGPKQSWLLLYIFINDAVVSSSSYQFTSRPDPFLYAKLIIILPFYVILYHSHEKQSNECFYFNSYFFNGIKICDVDLDQGRNRIYLREFPWTLSYKRKF